MSQKNTLAKLYGDSRLDLQITHASQHSQAALTQIQELNPRVNLLTANFGTLLADHVFFGVYSLVIATDLPLNILTQLNVSCRMQSRPFYAAGSFGFYGFIFTDLIQHTYIISREKSNIETKLGPETPTRSIIDVTSSRGSDGKTTEQVTKTETYTPINLANTSRLTPWHLANRRRKFLVSPILSCIRALWDYQATTGNVELSHTAADLAHFTRLANEKHKELSLPPETLRSDIVKSFVQGIGSEIGSVCACLGARLAEDVINVVGGKEQPIQNFVVFDGDETKAQIYALHTDMNMTLRNGNGVPLTDLASVPYTNGSSALNVGSTSQHARTISNGSINMNMPV